MVNYVSNEQHKQNERRLALNEHLTDQKSIYLQIGEMIETDILRGILLEEDLKKPKKKTDVFDIRSRS